MQNHYPDQSAGGGDGPPFYSSNTNQQPSNMHQDEIQLTAQLSRSLAPIMSSSAGGNMSNNQEEHQEHQEHGTANHHYNNDQHLNIHGQPVQGGHAPIDMSLQYQVPADNIPPPRKRSKVSRACDECRRKKIKCDASVDQGEEPTSTCSSCARTRSKCEFSRQPQKRGPSKGYIKDLADRLNNLEGAFQPRQQTLSYDSPHQHRRLSDEFAPTNPGTGPRKRSFSAISGELNANYPAARSSNNWAPQEEHRELQLSAPYNQPHTPPTGVQPYQDPEYSPNGLQPSPQWRSEPAPPGRQSSSSENMDHYPRAQRALEPNNRDLERYHNLIHPTFPIIQQSQLKLSATLKKCHTTLVDAFNESLLAAIASFSKPTIRDYKYDFQQEKEAAQFTMVCQVENLSAQSFEMSLMHLQSLLFMAIAVSNRPRHKTHDQNLGPTSIWLGLAVGVAYQLRLHVHSQPDKGTENDLDSDGKLARNLWWILVIMDRWHALSTGTPPLIPDSSIVVYPEDKVLLEETTYQYARLSIIVGHVAEVNVMPHDLPTFSVPPMVSTLIRGETERWREGLSDFLAVSSNAPLLHISCWTLRAFKELLSPDPNARELLNCAKHIVKVLIANPKFISPMTHHSIAVAAMVLIELRTIESTTDEAGQHLMILGDEQGSNTQWHGVTRCYIADYGTSDATPSHHALTASQGLQRLADIATAAGETRDSGSDENRAEPEKNHTSSVITPPSPFRELKRLMKDGYLNAFTRMTEFTRASQTL